MHAIVFRRQQLQTNSHGTFTAKTWANQAKNKTTKKTSTDLNQNIVVQNSGSFRNAKLTPKKSIVPLDVLKPNRELRTLSSVPPALGRFTNMWV